MQNVSKTSRYNLRKITSNTTKQLPSLPIASRLSSNSDNIPRAKTAETWVDTFFSDKSTDTSFISTFKSCIIFPQLAANKKFNPLTGTQAVK
jgi:hypothetical protein